VASKGGASGRTQRFLDYAKPNEHGYTRVISIEELNAHYKTTEFSTQNGGDWCRSSAPLLAGFNVERIKGVVAGKAGRRIVAVQLKGHKASKMNIGIRSDIKRVIALQKCAILATSSDIQVDHKCPRLDLTPHVWDPKTQTPSDFQALCRAANASKRGHCQACVDSKTRFDATLLGYSVSQWTGGSRFSGSCVGCYWYDPVEFNARVSAGFKPIRFASPTKAAGAICPAPDAAAQPAACGAAGVCASDGAIAG